CAIPAVYVTHAHNEALILAALLAIMNRGRIEQIGTCEAIYQEPRNEFVAGFLNLHTGSPPISFVDAADLPAGRALGDVRVGVRPEDVEISTTERPDAVRGTVTSALRLPIQKDPPLTIPVGQHEVQGRTDIQADVAKGDAAWLTFTRYHVFDKASGARLRTST